MQMQRHGCVVHESRDQNRLTHVLVREVVFVSTPSACVDWENSRFNDRVAGGGMFASCALTTAA